MTEQHPIARYFLPKFQDILFATIFYIVIYFGPQLFIREGDLARHLSVGRYILETRSIPTSDIFSYTVFGKPWSPHEWLAEILFFGGYAQFGLNAVVILVAFVTAMAFLVIYKDSITRSGGASIPLLLTILGAFASSAHWLARPHMFTMLILALWTFWLDGERRGEKRPIWIYPGLMVIWANTHGEFIAGFLVIGAYFAGWLWELIVRSEEKNPGFGKRLIFISAGAFLASLANPVGLGTWSTVAGYLANKYLITHTLETQSPDFQVFGFLPLLILIVFSLLLMGLSKSKLPAGQVILLAGIIAMTLSSARNVHLLGIIAPPILSNLLGNEIPRNSPLGLFEQRLAFIGSHLRGSFWSLAAGLILSFLVLSGTPLDSGKKGNEFDPKLFPVQAVDWIETHPLQGNVFNHFDWGGYILLRMWPEQKVFIDSQTDVYGEALTRQYEQVTTLSPGWEEILASYKVEWVFVPTSSSLARVLSVTSNWEIAYADDTAIIFIRGEGP